MSKVYYNVLNDSCRTTKPKNCSGRYFLIEDNPAEKYKAIKLFMSKAITETITGYTKALIEVDLVKDIDGTFIEITFPNEITFPKRSKIKVSALKGARIEKIYKAVIKELFEKENIYIYDKKWSNTAYAIIFLDRVTDSKYDPDYTILSLNMGGNIAYNLRITNEDFIKNSKELRSRFKIDTSSYVHSIKEILKEAKYDLSECEEKVLLLKEKVLNIQKKYDELEDYEKLIGEITNE